MIPDLIVRIFGDDKILDLDPLCGGWFFEWVYHMDGRWDMNGRKCICG